MTQKERDWLDSLRRQAQFDAEGEVYLQWLRQAFQPTHSFTIKTDGPEPPIQIPRGWPWQNS